MPFFNFRRGSATPPNAALKAQPESMDVVRKRAKHRLIGTAVLVLAGVVGFPLLFDTQPRPIAIDIPIEIPGKNTVKPLVMPGKPDAVKEAALPIAESPAVVAPVGTVSAPVQDKVEAASSLGVKEEIVTDKKPALAPQSSILPMPPVAKKEADAVVKPEPKATAKFETKSDDGARAKALLDGQAASAAAPAIAATPAEGRMVVQVGAFADADKAKEVRQKLERAGLKTYTQVAETSGGKRIRVRVGPFANRAEAEKAAGKIKTLDLPAAILTL